MSNYHPRFVQILHELDKIPEQEKLTSEKASFLMAEAMHYAPPEFKQMCEDKMIELGLMPNVSGYSDDGEPLVSIDEVCRIYGLTPEQAIEYARKMEQRTGQNLLRTKVNRIN